MKRVTFIDSIELDPQTTQTVTDFLNKSFKDGILKFNNIEVKSELPQTKNFQVVGKSLYNILFLLEFVLKFVFNLLYNSNAASNIKSPPYFVNVDLCVDFENSKFRIHLFVDDQIYGLVVGKNYRYVANIITCIQPILAKMRLDGEVRFFPESKYGLVNDINDSCYGEEC